MPVNLNSVDSYQHQPLIAAHSDQRAKPRQPLGTVMGVHIWQIFTAMTIILTVASSLLYFNSIVPRNRNEEFVTITKSKTTFYNQNEYINTFYNDNFNRHLVGVQLSGACYSGVNDISEELPELSTDLDELNEQRRLISAFRSEHDKHNFTNEYSKLLVDYSNSIQDYLTAVILMFERQEIYRSQTLNIQKAASSVCESSLDQVDEKLQNYDAAVNEFSLESLSTMEDWLQNAKQWRETTSQLVETIDGQDVFNIGAVTAQVEQFKQEFVEIFAAAYDYDTYQKEIEERYGKTLLALRAVEEYELDYIAANESVKGNTIFVTFKDSEME